MARFPESRHNRDITFPNRAKFAMKSPLDLLERLRSHPDGASLTELADTTTGVSRRTVQRWLQQLEQQGQVTALGEGRARRYQAGQNRPDTGPSTAAPYPADIPLSAAGREIMSHVRQAHHLGDTAVGFQMGVKLLRLTRWASVIRFTLNQ